MWRVLRAIQKILSNEGFKLSVLQREQLFQSLTNARCYNEKPGKRFLEYTIPRKIVDIAKLSKTGLSKRLSEILSPDQHREFARSAVDR